MPCTHIELDRDNRARAVIELAIFEPVPADGSNRNLSGAFAANAPWLLADEYSDVCDVPRRILARRVENELAGREMMHGGRWLDER